ncbi:TPA: QueT transporter family protein [Streptococcus pyogenes]
MTKLTVHDYVHIGLVAALYVVLTITPPLNAISYGMYQFRISEMMNFLAFYHRKYIIAVTLGCMIANFYSFGLIDVFVGGGSTLIFVTLGVILFSKYQKDYLFNGIFNKAFVYFSFFFCNFHVYCSNRTLLLWSSIFINMVYNCVGRISISAHRITYY